MYKISASTLFIGQKLVFVPECHSTNTLAMELAQKAASPEGTVVITANQTSGRGQRGNTWEAAPGQNLTFSVILQPTFLEVTQQFYLTKVISLGLIDFLSEAINMKSFIKWPNDIIVQEKKICGILIENSISATKIAQSIGGIGLNVNQTDFLLTTPTSMALQAGHTFDLNAQLNMLLQKIEGRYLQLRAGKYQQLKESYHQNLYWLNEEHQFESAGKFFSGTIKGVDDIGKLIVHHGKESKFDLKEIRFVS